MSGTEHPKATKWLRVWIVVCAAAWVFAAALLAAGVSIDDDHFGVAAAVMVVSLGGIIVCLATQRR